MTDLRASVTRIRTNRYGAAARTIRFHERADSASVLDDQIAFTMTKSARIGGDADAKQSSDRCRCSPPGYKRDLSFKRIPRRPVQTTHGGNKRRSIYLASILAVSAKCDRSRSRQRVSSAYNFWVETCQPDPEGRARGAARRAIADDGAGEIRVRGARSQSEEHRF